MKKKTTEGDLFRKAIWSDDSTEQERGGETPEDAARFISGLRATIERLKSRRTCVHVNVAGDCSVVADNRKLKSLIRKKARHESKIRKLLSEG